MKIAVHKITKYCYEYQVHLQLPNEFDEIEIESLSEISELYLEGFPKYKYENEELITANFKLSEEYKNSKEKEIDTETYHLIKKWCKEQTKCEEYYLRQAKTSTDFITYNSKCIDIIASQQTKKVNEGII